MPDDLAIVGWLDCFPEMAEVRAAYATDPVLGPRVDAPLGTTFARQGSNFYWILAQHVIERIVVGTRSYHLDEEVFDQIYVEFERRFGTQRSNAPNARLSYPTVLLCIGCPSGISAWRSIRRPCRPAMGQV